MTQTRLLREVAGDIRQDVPERVGNPRLPRTVVRDLLGIARALYATRNADGASADELGLIERAGKAFATSLELSLIEPGTVGHRASWGWAEKGLTLLGEALQGDELGRAVEAIGERLRVRR